MKSDIASTDLIRADYNETSLTELANLPGVPKKVYGFRRP